MTCELPGGCSIHWATENLWRVRLYTRFILRTRLLHTAKISNVDAVLCGERTKAGKFYARWNKCENELISLLWTWNKEKIQVADRIWIYNLPNTARDMLINLFSHQRTTCFATLLQKNLNSDVARFNYHSFSNLLTT